MSEERIRAHAAIVTGVLGPLDELERRAVLAEVARQLRLYNIVTVPMGFSVELPARAEKITNHVSFGSEEDTERFAFLDDQDENEEDEDTYEWLSAWRMMWAEVATAIARQSLHEAEASYRADVERGMVVGDVIDLWIETLAKHRHAERFATRELQALCHELDKERP